jgi:preprotein translocase subunit SecG
METKKIDKWWILLIFFLLCMLVAFLVNRQKNDAFKVYENEQNKTAYLQRQ